MIARQHMPGDFSRNIRSHFLPKAIKRIIALFLLLLFCKSGYSQLFYSIETKLHTTDNKPLTYRIFLKLADDGSTAAARIAFKDPVTGKSRMVKQYYVNNDFPDKSYSDTVVYLLPFGTAFNDNDVAEKNFVTPRFLFYKSKSMMLPDAKVKVQYSYNNQQWFSQDSGKSEAISWDRTKRLQALVKEFFSKDEAFYKSTFNIPRTWLNADEAHRTIHLIAIGATNDPDIGETTQTDLYRVHDLFITDAPNWRNKFEYTEISGKNFTKKAVNDAIDKLKPLPKDVVIIYYSGHGFRYTDDVSPYPRMALVANAHQSPDDANLGVEDIYKRILKKGARVNIVLADCCNEEYGTIAPPGMSQLPPQAAPGSPPPLNLDNWRALFVPNHPLSVLACAAEKTQLAHGDLNLGGYFSNFAVTELYKSLYGNPADGEASWTRLLNIAKEYTRRQALTAPCKGGGPCVGDRSLQLPMGKVSVVK